MMIALSNRIATAIAVSVLATGVSALAFPAGLNSSAAMQRPSRAVTREVPAGAGAAAPPPPSLP